MSDTTPWKVWQPDDLSPPMEVEFTPLTLDEPDAEQEEISAEQLQQQQLAQLQIQAHEQGYQAGLREGHAAGQQQGYQEGPLSMPECSSWRANFSTPWIPSTA